MPSRRWSGGTKKPASAALTARSARLMPPAVFCSSPSTIRNVVVLPQPDGASRVTNSPRSILRLTLSTATTSPNWRLTSSTRTAGIFCILSQRADALLDQFQLHPAKEDDEQHHQQADDADLLGLAVGPKLEQHDREYFGAD